MSITLDMRQEDVDRGMAWLDELIPKWLDRIDLKTLDFSSCFNCVAGQVFAVNLSRTNGYDHVKSTYFRNSVEETARHGFSEYRSESHDALAVYEVLEVLWVKAITKRLAA